MEKKRKEKRKYFREVSTEAVNCKPNSFMLNGRLIPNNPALLIIYT
jgi:hypothetical protein